jgi:flagellar protein FlbD
MIHLHRLGHADERVLVNPDLVAFVEANPDTVVTLTTERRIVVAETPEEVVEAVREWRVAILADALKRRR